MIRIYKNLSTKLSVMVNSLCAFVATKRYSLKRKTLFWHQQHCQLCDEALNNRPFVCDNCYADLPAEKVMCKVCCLPLEMSYSDSNSTTLVCGECIAFPPSFTRTLCPFKYEFPVLQLIKRVKYSKQRYWLKFLSWALNAEYLSALQHQSIKRPDCLIPIPLHKTKLKSRGYNQAELIAQLLAKETGILINTKALLKTVPTGTQAKLNKQERMTNLKDSFALSKQETKKGYLKDKHIALIDDVMTTKATCELASSLLLRHGVKQVDVWCLARTPKLR